VHTFPLTNCPFVGPPSPSGFCPPCPSSVPSFPTQFTLYTETEKTDSSKIPTPIYQITWCHIPVDHNLWTLTTIFKYKFY
jgi:hypothetical protein